MRIGQGWVFAHGKIFAMHLETEFRDLHHALRHQSILFDLRQWSSVARYNEEFWAIMLEVQQPHEHP